MLGALTAVCLRGCAAGQPVRGGTSAEAEGGAVRSDPGPQSACPSRLRVAPRPEEAAPSPGEPGGREGPGRRCALCQNPAAAAGASQTRRGALEAFPPPRFSSLCSSSL